MKKSVKFVSEIEAIKFFEQFIGSAMLQFVSLTNPKVNKTSRITKEETPFDCLQHMKNFNAQVGYKYEKQVNDKASNEGLNPEFVAQAHKWAEHVKGAMFCRKRDGGGAYVAYAQKRIDDSDYFADGVMIADVKTLAEYMPEKKPYANQPAEDKVFVQMLKIENVVSFTFDETIHYVVH